MFLIGSLTISMQVPDSLRSLVLMPCNLRTVCPLYSAKSVNMFSFHQLSYLLMKKIIPNKKERFYYPFVNGELVWQKLVKKTSLLLLFLCVCMKPLNWNFSSQTRIILSPDVWFSRFIRESISMLFKCCIMYNVQWVKLIIHIDKFESSSLIVPGC